MHVKPFHPFHFTLSDIQLTTIVEVNVVWKRLVLRREVGSIVFEELPFHPIFILLFLPPDTRQEDEKVKIAALLPPCSLLLIVCACAGVG